MKKKKNNENNKIYVFDYFLLALVLLRRTNFFSGAPMATANGVAAILNFFAELCAEKDISDWLGSAEGSAFWNPLLMLLCCNRYICFFVVV